MSYAFMSILMLVLLGTLLGAIKQRLNAWWLGV